MYQANTEMNQAKRDTVPLAERVERNIEAIIAAHVTVWGVDLSDLLAEQRAKIVELQCTHRELMEVIRTKDQAYDKLHAAYSALLPCAPSPTPDPINTCAPEKPAEEDGEGEAGIGIEIRVTGEGPMPPGLTAMLNDLTSMLQSVARKK